jgi:ABC-type dipeptide/oligopeptide/nickel transport system permease component
MGDLELYITSFYFTVTTLMTVGYGDITAYSKPEKIVCIFLMLIGVVAFSFATGYISSIITNQDSVEARMNEKMGTLEILRDEYGLDKELFIRVLNTVKFDLKQNSSRDVLDFI